MNAACAPPRAPHAIDGAEIAAREDGPHDEATAARHADRLDAVRQAAS